MWLLCLSGVCDGRNDVIMAALTSKVANEVFQKHLAFWFNVGTVHVSVEQDDGKGQDKDGVWIMELLHYIRVTHAVPLTTTEKQTKQEMQYSLKTTRERTGRQ